MTNQNLNYKIRYLRYVNDNELSHTSGAIPVHPRGVLITIQEGQTIYFGISRCKLSADNFRKSEGKKLALDRALSAKSKGFDSSSSGWNVAYWKNSFHLDETGLSGYCHVSHVKLLLKYFESLGLYKKWKKQ